MGSIVREEEGAGEFDNVPEENAEIVACVPVGALVTLTVELVDTVSVHVCVHVNTSVAVEVADLSVDGVTLVETLGDFLGVAVEQIELVEVFV